MNARRRPLVFHKMHSLGNDFMIIDAVSQAVQLDERVIAAWGDRHRGIGFDQLLMIEAPTTPDADFNYRIFNADGSSAQQCGNGTRCVAMLAQQSGLSVKNRLVWQSAAGMFETVFRSPAQIETTMTVPVLNHADIPFAPEHAETTENPWVFNLQAGEQVFAVTPVSMGNPHAVLFCDDIFSLDIDQIGGSLTGHPAFPEGANVGFCQVVDRQFIRLRVFERGAGETQACGSGACAAIVAARLHDKVGERVKVSLPGGKLRIKWPDSNSPVTMAGEASYVYRGELQLDQ
ncbi:MAG: diaminopimelate epimerase [bacterium]